MDTKLKSLFVENFKSYSDFSSIPVSDLSVLLGANSSGKSTALQALLVLKQTLECNSPDIELLLSGRYITLGDYLDVINDITKGYFKVGISTEGNGTKETVRDNDNIDVFWTFSKNDEKVILKELNYNLESEKIFFKRMLGEKRIYNIYVNSKQTFLSVELTNLDIIKFLVHYNVEFSELFYNFLKSILNCLVTNKSIYNLKGDEDAYSRMVDEFYYTLMRFQRNNLDETKAVQNENAEILAEEIITLINKFSHYQSAIFEWGSFLPDEIGKSLLVEAIKNLDNAEILKKIIIEYQKKYDNFTNNNNNSAVPETYEAFPVYTIRKFENGKADETTIYSLVAEACVTYKNILDEILKKIFYLGPIREKPQGLYNIGFEMVPKYVGPTGAYFASVLLREDKQRTYIMPNDNAEEVTLSEALCEWANHLNVASKIEVDKSNSFGFSVSIFNTQQKKSDIMNTGIGTSQVLPVLIMGLLSDEGEYLIFEQPELHLHPYSQSRLADFFIALVNNGRKVLVETHSEYLLLRLRYHVLSNHIDANNISINFFQNNSGTKISQGILSEYGDFQYPEDFKDETQQLLSDLLNTALMKRDV